MTPGPKSRAGGIVLSATFKKKQNKKNSHLILLFLQGKDNTELIREIRFFAERILHQIDD